MATGSNTAPDSRRPLHRTAEDRATFRMGNPPVNAMIP